MIWTGLAFIAVGSVLLVFSSLRVATSDDYLSMTPERRRVLIDEEREQTSRMGGL